MAIRVSAQSTLEQPSGMPAVVIPDVFPAVTDRDDLSNVHDIMGGQLPNPDIDNKRAGWLRLAMPTGDYPAYIDPELSPEEQHKMHANYRRTETGKVTVDTARSVPRGMIRLDDLTARVRIERSSVYFPGIERNLFEAWPVESALAFTGRIALSDGEKRIFGMHFPSMREHGWARLLDSADNGGESAKVQHDARATGQFEQILSRLR